MESTMQSDMQSQRTANPIAERIGNDTSDSMGNSHTPYSIPHSPAERLADVTSPEPLSAPEGFASPGDVIAAGQLWRTETRHPRIRTGERDPIPLYVRLAIWYRDQGKCAECPHGYELTAPHLDHIKPWSAGGTDTSDNLRLLCEQHNVARSNFIDYAQPKRPVTWWCHRCHDLDYRAAGQYLECPRHRWNYGGKTYCRAARASVRWGDASWFIRPIPEDYPHIAYCAHCDAPGMTGVLL